MLDDTQDTIRLGTNNGMTGYKIKKFRIMPGNPTADNMEATVKLYKYEQDANTNTIDFNDGKLLGAAYIENHDSASPGFSNFTNAVIFDNVVFNQDIYITLAAGSGSGSDGVNYYLELEQVKLDLNEATVATLKDMRGSS